LADFSFLCLRFSSPASPCGAAPYNDASTTGAESSGECDACSGERGDVGDNGDVGDKGDTAATVVGSVTGAAVSKGLHFSSTAILINHYL
jgi:hypothetical protein